MFKFMMGCLTCAVVAQGAGAQGPGESGGQKISRAGSATASPGPAAYFTGEVRVEPVFPVTSSINASGGLVTFQPGARSAWHTHPAGQHLVVTAGVGLTQEWGKAVQEVRAGDVVWCPPGVKHWHGASPGTGVSQLAITGSVEGRNVDWLEKVTDEQYASR